jgi:UDP-N-acetylmuramate dehydrogenase
MRVGGPAEVLAVYDTTDELCRAVQTTVEHGLPWKVIGAGCNILVADSGLRCAVFVNKAAQAEFRGEAGSATVWAEAGAPMAIVARNASELGWSGLEWAAGLPGTVGGAVVGNAGAFEGDIATCLRSASILEIDSQGPATTERRNPWFEFDYRLSRIKRMSAEETRPVILAATFTMEPGDPVQLTRRVGEIVEWRQTRHPSGATMGSTFKNPPGSHAGYLIEQAGLRGRQIGGARISELHGNFFMNVGSATASDVLALIEHARTEVHRQFGIDLELEIELVGWQR